MPEPTMIVIPARLAATRLPDKPLAMIAGVPMIVQVWRRAIEADIGPVLVAAGDPEILEIVREHGGDAVLTDSALPSGTDRIRAALALRDPSRRHKRIINLQGDLPTIDPALLRTVLAPLDHLCSDIGTLAVARHDPSERADPDVVKAVVAFDRERPQLGRALYFTRCPAPYGEGPFLHHIGIYAWSREVLERFADLPPSPLEGRERLEQLRALEHGMTIGVACVDTIPLGVDTPEHLERARAILEAPNGTDSASE